MHTKSKAFATATDRVASGLEANEALLFTTDEGLREARSKKELLDAAQASTKERARAQNKRFHATLATSKLRDVARAQIDTLRALHAEKMRWVQRSFPSFVTVHHSGGKLASPG